MLCWLELGDHVALGRDVSGAPNFILTNGLPHYACRIRPTDDRAIAPCAPPLGGYISIEIEKINTPYPGRRVNISTRFKNKHPVPRAAGKP